MNWQLDINTLIQILSAACIVGMGWQKIGQLEKDIERLEEEVVAHRDMKADMTIVKSRLIDLNDKLLDISEKFERLISGAGK